MIDSISPTGILSKYIQNYFIVETYNSIDKNIYVLSFLGAIGGASEMILPNIIKQFEDEI